MFYMVWMTGDYDDSYDWFQILGTKQSAMKFARRAAKEQGKSVKFVYDNGHAIPNDVADPSCEILVWATDNYYHGA